MATPALPPLRLSQPMIRHLLILMTLAPLIASGASTNTAGVRLFCISIRVEPGSASQFGLDYHLTFSSADFSPPNDEVFPIFQDTASHATYFLLDGPEFPEPLPGELDLVVPEDLDADTNGIPDFYEVKEEIAAAGSDGVWGSPTGTGTARLTWQRQAGHRDGTVAIQLTSDEFGDLPEFSHPFEIIEYGGTLQYQPTSGTVTGLVALKRVGLETSTLAGPLVMDRNPTNHLLQFTINGSNLTNEMGQTVPVSVGDLESDPDYVMDYFGVLALLNGDPATPEIDYELFYMGIDDSNDADNDGIPDLTDDLETPPTPPRLLLAREGASLRLDISGQSNFVYTLERASTLAPDPWVSNRLVTLSQTNLSIALPDVSGPSGFWRLRWP